MAKTPEWEWLDLKIPEYEDGLTARVRKALKKLRPGEEIRNGNTKAIGTPMADKDSPKRLLLGTWVYVAVRTRIREGKSKGKCTYPRWHISHIQIRTQRPH